MQFGLGFWLPTLEGTPGVLASGVTSTHFLHVPRNPKLWQHWNTNQMSGLTFKSPRFCEHLKVYQFCYHRRPQEIHDIIILQNSYKWCPIFIINLEKFSMFFGDTFIFWCLMALEKSFALSAQYLGRLDICGGNIRAFHILSVGGYLVAWALNCSPSHDLPCVCAELTHTWFPSQHHANTYNLTLNTTR